jgi:hypothetical protein
MSVHPECEACSVLRSTRGSQWPSSRAEWPSSNQLLDIEFPGRRYDFPFFPALNLRRVIVMVTPGEAVQVELITFMSKVRAANRLKIQYDEPPSSCRGGGGGFIPFIST